MVYKVLLLLGKSTGTASKGGPVVFENPFPTFFILKVNKLGLKKLSELPRIPAGTLNRQPSFQECSRLSPRGHSLVPELKQVRVNGYSMPGIARTSSCNSSEK